MADLTPEQKRKLQAELEKYAKEGASDDDLRGFRDELISQYERLNQTSKKKVPSGVAVPEDSPTGTTPASQSLLLSSVSNAGKAPEARPKAIVDLAPKEERKISTKGGKEFSVLLPSKGDADLINPADGLQRELDEKLKKTNLTDEDIEFINQYTPAGINKELVKAYAKSNIHGQTEEVAQQNTRKRASVIENISRIGNLYKDHTAEEILTDSKAATDFIHHFESLPAPKRNMVFTGTGVGGAGQAEESDATYNLREDVRRYNQQKEVYELVSKDLKDSHVQGVVNKVASGQMSLKDGYREAAKIVNPRAFKNKETAENAKPWGVMDLVGGLLDKATEALGVTDYGRTLKAVEGYGAKAFQDNLDAALTERLNIAQKAGDQKEIARLGEVVKRISNKDVIYDYPVLIEQQLAKEASDEVARIAGATDDSEAENLPGWYLKIFGKSGIPVKNQVVYEFFKSKGYLTDARTKDVANGILTKMAMENLSGGLIAKDVVAESSLFGSARENLMQPFTELFKGVGSLSGIRTEKARVAGKMTDEMFPKEAEDLSTSMSIGRNIINTTANVAGQAALQYATMGLGKYAGLADKAARTTAFWTSGALPAYDQALKESSDFIDNNRAGRNLYATAVAMFTGFSEKLFPEIKLLEIPGVKPFFSEMSSHLSAGTLTRELSEELLGKAKNAVLDYSLKYGKNIGQEVVEEVSTSVFTDVNRLLWGDREMNLGKLVENAGETAYQTAVGTALVGAWGAYGDVRNEKNSTYKSMIYNAAVYNDQAEDAIHKGFEANLYNEAERDSKMKVLNTAKNRLNDLNVLEQDRRKKLDIQQRQVYVANTTASSLLSEELEDLRKNKVNPERQTELQNQIANLYKQSQEILDNDLTFDETLSPVVERKNYNVRETENGFMVEGNNGAPDRPATSITAIEVKSLEEANALANRLNRGLEPENTATDTAITATESNQPSFEIKDEDFEFELDQVVASPQLTIDFDNPNNTNDATSQTQTENEEAGTEGGANQPIGTAQREQESTGEEEAQLGTDGSNSVRSGNPQEEEVVPTRGGVSVIRPSSTPGVAPVSMGGGAVSVIRPTPSRISVTQQSNTQPAVTQGGVSVIRPQQDVANTVVSEESSDMPMGTLDEAGNITIQRQSDEKQNTNGQSQETAGAQTTITDNQANQSAATGPTRFEGTYQFEAAQDVDITNMALNSSLRPSKPVMAVTRMETSTPSMKPALAYRRGGKTIILDGRARVLAAKARGDKSYPVRYLIDGTEELAKEVASFAATQTLPTRLTRVRAAEAVSQYEEGDFRQSMLAMLIGHLDGKLGRPLFTKEALIRFSRSISIRNPARRKAGLKPSEWKMLEKYNLVGQGGMDADFANNTGPNFSENWVDATGMSDMELMQEVWDMINDYVLPYSRKEDAINSLADEMMRVTNDRSLPIQFFELPLTEDEALFVSDNGLEDLLLEVYSGSPEFDAEETRLLEGIIVDNSREDQTTDIDGVYRDIFESTDPDIIQLANKITAYATSKERQYNRSVSSQASAQNQEGSTAEEFDAGFTEDVSFSRAAAEGIGRLTPEEAEKVSSTLSKAFGTVVNISNDFFKQVEKALKKSVLTTEAQNLTRELERVQQVYAAAQTAFNAKRNEFNKTTKSDQVDLFGNRASDQAAGMFDVRVDPAAREAAIKPYADRVAKAKADVAKVHKRLAEALRSGNTSQTTMFSFDGQKVLGFVAKDGTVYLNPEQVRADTPIHEIGGHILFGWARKNNVPLYNKMLEVARSAPQALKDFVKANYPEFSSVNKTEGEDKTDLIKEAKEWKAKGYMDKRQVAINELPKKKVNYKQIKKGGNLAAVFNNPEILNSTVFKSAKKIYEDITRGEAVRDTPYVNENMELLDGINRVSAQVASGIENIDVVVLDDAAYDFIDKRIGELTKKYDEILATVGEDKKQIKIVNSTQEVAESEAFLEEVFATAMGWNENNIRRTEALATAAPPSLVAKIKDIWNDFVNWLIDNNKIAAKYLTLRLNEADFSKMSLADLTTFLGEKMFTGRRMGTPPAVNIRASSADFSFLGDSDFIYDAFGNIIDVKPEVKAGIFNEKQAIKNRAIALGNFMLAPDGTQSKLNEDQWLTTQTVRFQAWDKGVDISPIFEQLKDAKGITGSIIKSLSNDSTGELIQYLLDQSNTAPERTGLKNAIGNAAFKTLMDFKAAKGNALRNVNGEPSVMYLDEDNTGEGTVHLQSAGTKPVFAKGNRVLNVDTPEGTTIWANAVSTNPSNPEAVLAEAGYDMVVENNGSNAAVINPKGNIKSAVSNSTFSQETNDVRFQRIGAKAKLTAAQKDSLAIAERMEREGRPADNIALVTGWFKGPVDKLWRYELSNQNVRFAAPPSGTSAPLQDYLVYEELYAAYPDIKNLEVRSMTGAELFQFAYPGRPVPAVVSNAGGLYFRDNKYFIALNSDLPRQDQYLTLRHEVQHYIQDAEGFEQGGNEKDATNQYNFRLKYNKGLLNDTVNHIDLLARRVAEIQTTLNTVNDPEYIVLPGAKEMSKEWSDRLANYKAKINELEATASYLRNENDALENNKEAYLYYFYTQIAGETEARSVEERAMMNDIQRMSSFPISAEERASYASDKFNPEVNIPFIFLQPSEQVAAKLSVRADTSGKGRLKWQRTLLTDALNALDRGYDLRTYYKQDEILSLLQVNSLSELEPQELQTIRVIAGMNATQIKLLLGAVDEGIAGKGQVDYDAAYKRVKGDIINAKTKTKAKEAEVSPDEAGDPSVIQQRLAKLYNPVVGSSPYRANTTLEEAGMGDAGRPAYGSETTISAMVRDKLGFIEQLDKDTGGKAVAHLLSYLGFDKYRGTKVDDLEGQIPSTGNDFQLANVLITLLERGTVNDIGADIPMAQKKAYIKYLKGVSKSLGRGFGQALNTAKFRRVISEIAAANIMEGAISREDAAMVSDAENQIADILTGAEYVSDDIIRLRQLNDNGYTFYVNVPNEGERQVPFSEVEAAFKGKGRKPNITARLEMTEDELLTSEMDYEEQAQQSKVLGKVARLQKKKEVTERRSARIAEKLAKEIKDSERKIRDLLKQIKC